MPIRSSERSKVVCIVGTRPEVIKMAPVIRALRAAPQLELSVLSSGQHRDLLAPLLEQRCRSGALTVPTR